MALAVNHNDAEIVSNLAVAKSVMFKIKDKLEKIVENIIHGQETKNVLSSEMLSIMILGFLKKQILCHIPLLLGSRMLNTMANGFRCSEIRRGSMCFLPHDPRVTTLEFSKSCHPQHVHV